MIAWLISEFGGWLAGVGAVIIALVTAWWRGRASAKQQTALEAAEAYAHGRKEMDDAPDFSNDPDAGRRWLRERDANQR